MTMVEKMARAMLAEARRVGPIELSVLEWENVDVANRRILLAAARAAIEAMREPTEGMLTAAWGESLDTPDPGCAWDDMITAALHEGEPREQASPEPQGDK